jgi:protein-L-isoaspartate(D-aspartate) O-methyltransferase
MSILRLPLLLLLLFAEPWTAQRNTMVQEQMARRGIRDAEVLAVMRAVPRHEFVPLDQRDRAYADHPLPIGHEATISQPYIVAAMTELLDVKKGHKVLEIGTGSGYQAAVLAKLAGQVYTIEIVPELAQRARRDLQRLGYVNVHVRAGDGYKGWPEQAPFDRIILTAAPPSVPQALIDQLKRGGRMVTPVGATPWDQKLMVLEKTEKNTVEKRFVMDVRFVPMVPGK